MKRESIQIYINPQFVYKSGISPMSYCKVEIYSNVIHDRYVVVMTELPDNPGMSVTNAVEVVVENIYNTVKELEGVTMDKISFVEHYFHEGNIPETYDLVTFNSNWTSFSSPEWKHLSIEDFEHLLR